MYYYFEDKAFLNDARRLCSSLVSAIQDEVRQQGIACQFFLVGSGGRNLVTYLERRDGTINIDFDYNLNILFCNNINDCLAIKETVRKATNKVLRKRYGKEGAQDSTSSITIPGLYFNDNQNILFSIDLCIVTRDDDGHWYRLIHDKRRGGGYHWDKVRDSHDLEKKVEFLKRTNHWDGEGSVRQRYLELKNIYLSRNDDEHPSFICYIEAVNELYNKYR